MVRKGKSGGALAGMLEAREGTAIEKQWGEKVGGMPAEGPSADAALPGRRMAIRSDGSNAKAPGGEGNGHVSHAPKHGKR